MSTTDIPDIPQRYTSAIVAPKDGGATTPVKDRVFGICLAQLVDEPTSLRPEDDLRYYLNTYEAGDASVTPPGVTVVLLQGPQHGVIEDVPYIYKNVTGVEHMYHPNKDYIGDDKVVYQTSYGGKTVKSVYILKMRAHVSEHEEGNDGICKENMWKISSTDQTPTTITYSNLLQAASADFKGFSDLPAGEVGNTTGEGANAAITLDITANGCGWYQITNPFNNSSVLLTADANIRLAKAVSAADGKK